jgi:hypothetical protein
VLTALVALPAALPAALVALSAAPLTAAVAVGFAEPACLREDARFRELVGFLVEPRERAWDFSDPVDRFDGALVLV